MKSLPTASRVRATISIGNRIRFSKLPPQPSVRRFVCAAMNWLMKYPSDPMISTPSYPASRASDAQRTKARICRSIPRSLNARGVNGEIGDFKREGATASG